ncbi:acyl carrier protein [Sphingobacterium humi]|uniref:Acyl carrier protein n=1 Tax=Sphingobacterium humi TaxID=1796905 RepID=A0A6N8KZN5_9SPHI|nr:phosphopantetheine-binding protein [Sphingobacterium humi]MVZ62546.1 acyl carrier protein [Sphingobacterium humi]
MNIEIVDIVNKINVILVEEFEVDEDVIEAGKNLKDTLDLDSLDYVDLVVIIESNFGVKLVESDFANVITFQDFYNLIERKILAKQQ